MHLNPPGSVHEVAVDGKIYQAFIDSHLPHNVVATEVLRISETDFQVRFGYANGPDQTFTATQVAEVRDGLWRWTSQSMQQAATSFGIPELWGTYPEGPDFPAAARTIHGGKPLLRAPMPTGETVVLAVELPRPPGDPLLHSAGATGRALDAYLVTSGCPAPIMRDGAIYDLPTGMLLDDIRSDTLYLSAEYQMLFDARVPQHACSLDVAGAVAHLATPQGPLAAQALVVATVTGDQWTWAWADPKLRGTRHATQTLRDFGLARSVPAFCTPRVPLKLAQAWDFDRVAKPVFGIWTHTFAQLTAETYALVLLSHPAFALPAPSQAIVQHVLETPCAPELSRERAQAFYLRARGLAVN